MLKFLLAIMKYLPKSLREKIFHYVLKKQMGKIFFELKSTDDVPSPFQKHLDELEKQKMEAAKLSAMFEHFDTKK